jgi:hypothetical protein
VTRHTVSRGTQSRRAHQQNKENGGGDPTHCDRDTLIKRVQRDTLRESHRMPLFVSKSVWSQHCISNGVHNGVHVPIKKWGTWGYIHRFGVHKGTKHVPQTSKIFPSVTYTILNSPSYKWTILLLINLFFKVQAYIT